MGAGWSLSSPLCYNYFRSSRGETRTHNLSVNSRLLCQLGYPELSSTAMAKVLSQSEWRASNPRPRVFVSLRSAQNYRPPDGMRPKSRMHPSTPHPDINLSSFVKELFISRFCGVRGSANYPEPLFYLIVSPLGEYFVPDSNRASQA